MWSRTQTCWHIADNKENIDLLKRIFPELIKKSVSLPIQNNPSSTVNTTTTTEDNQAEASLTRIIPAEKVPKLPIQDGVKILATETNLQAENPAFKKTTVLFEAGYILCKVNYRIPETQMLKFKQHPAIFYSRKRKSWCGRANHANINSFQQLFSIWNPLELQTILQKIPKETKSAYLEIDDRFKGKFSFKFYPLHAETLEFIKKIPNRNYQ